MWDEDLSPTYRNLKQEVCSHSSSDHHLRITREESTLKKQDQETEKEVLVIPLESYLKLLLQPDIPLQFIS